MSSDKPFKGNITHWRVQHYGDAKLVWGVFNGHPEFPEGSFGHTSQVVRHNEATGEIETRNSRYMLVGEPISDEEQHHD